MIQFNLLPNVKQDYVHAKRTKRITLLVAMAVAGASFAVMVLLFIGVQGVQKKYSSDLSADIKSESKKLEGIDDLNKILTIQNQLEELPGLHDEKPVAVRLLDFVKQVTPANVSIASIDVDFTEETITISGSAKAISDVNTFADTLKFTNYVAGDTKDAAFSEVVLANFGKDDKGTSYEISFKFDPNLFDSAYDVKLEVPPNKVTTRSQTEKPEALFQPLSNEGEAQ